MHSERVFFFALLGSSSRFQEIHIVKYEYNRHSPSLVSLFSNLTNENGTGREVFRGLVISEERVLKILIKPSGWLVLPLSPFSSLSFSFLYLSCWCSSAHITLNFLEVSVLVRSRFLLP